LEKFWCCLVEGTNGYSVIHAKFIEACGEAERLLQLPGNKYKKVFVLESIRSCELVKPDPPVLWNHF